MITPETPTPRYYQKRVRISRRQALRVLFSRRGLALVVRISGDGDFIASVRLEGCPNER